MMIRSTIDLKFGVQYASRHSVIKNTTAFLNYSSWPWSVVDDDFCTGDGRVITEQLIKRMEFGSVSLLESEHRTAKFRK